MKIHRNAQTQRSSEYVAAVPVDIQINIDSIEITPILEKISVKFTIEIEERSWGIKGMDVTINDFMDIQCEIDVEGGEVERGVFNIDLKNVRQDVRSSSTPGVCTLGALTIYLKEDFSVDYENTSIIVEK